MSHITKVRTTLTNKSILRETLESLRLNWTELENSTVYTSDIENFENSKFKILNSEKENQTKKSKLNLKKNPRIDFMVAQENDGSNIVFLWNGESYEIGVDFNYWQQKYSATFFVTRIEQEYALNLLKATAENLGLETEMLETQKATNTYEKKYTLVCRGWQND